MSNLSEIKTNFNTFSIKENIILINNFIEKINIDNNLKDIDLELIIMDTFEDFYNNYPFLVKKLCKQEDITILYKMLEKLDIVDSGKDNFLNVEKELADTLANKYLKNLNK